MTTQIKPVLCVVTSHPIKGDSGQPTGFWLSELTHVTAVLADSGIPFELASVRGGQPPVDGFDLSDPVNARLWNDASFRKALANSISLADVDTTKYSAVFFAGGHGTMWDFADSPAVQRVIREIYEAGGIVSAVCHGPAALVNVKLSDGSYLVAGKRVASFTDEEEAEVQATKIVPFLLASTLKARGALHQPAPELGRQRGDRWTSGNGAEPRVRTRRRRGDPRSALITGFSRKRTAPSFQQSRPSLATAFCARRIHSRKRMYLKWLTAMQLTPARSFG